MILPSYSVKMSSYGDEYMDKETFLLECSNPKNPSFANTQMYRDENGLFTEELLYAFDFRKANYSIGDLTTLIEKIRRRESDTETVFVPEGNSREQKDLEKITKSKAIRTAVKKIRADFNEKYPKTSIPKFGAYYSSKLHSNKWGNRYWFDKDGAFKKYFDGLLVNMMREQNIPMNFFNAIWWWVNLGYIPAFSHYGSVVLDKDRNRIYMDITHLSSKSEIAKRLESSWDEFKSLQEEHLGTKKEKFQPNKICQEVKGIVFIERSERLSYDTIHDHLLKKGFHIDRETLRKIYYNEKKLRLKSSSPFSK